MPRIQHLPQGHDKFQIGKEAVELSAHAGLELDPWQSWYLRKSMLTTDEMVYNKFTGLHEPRWAAFECGLCVCRQNGKGSIIEARELAGMFLTGERLIMHSAHEFPTALEAFERVLSLVRDTPDLWAEVRQVKQGHGEEGIYLNSGQRLRFKARTKGGGRGFTADCIILDEAMVLGTDQVKAMLPTVSARPNPQVWYAGSAGDKNSTQFGRVRHRAIKGGDPRLLYGEWSINPHTVMCDPTCDEHDDLDDPNGWAKANPALGRRISLEHIAAERRSMDDAAFGMERLGVGDWPTEDGSWGVISEDSWRVRESDVSEVVGRPVIAIHTASDRSFSAIFVCGLNADGDYHIELTQNADGEYDYRPGLGWALHRAIMIARRVRPIAIVVNKSTQAGVLFEDLEREIKAANMDRETQVISPLQREYAQGCADFFTGIVPKKGEKANVVHMGQEPLDKAVASTGIKESTDLWMWDDSDTTIDITPLRAATLALWGFKKLGHEEPPPPPFAFWA
ncbi:hypothetical protein [Rhodococcus sp. 11-3]|uniref:hypothetical protein n=1 Tax=Rhodococcus sp. 11-3 TaxID=2854796 RepID=UPI00204023F0|nr:hypothetical protein [Rhodococcus sp. 11-3]USC17030.1 hypothetical protein KZJ41_09260 [Rhodococcus sp. 11-3]